MLKIKSMAEHEALPEYVRNSVNKWEGTEEQIAAINNVTSGMCNTKPVKETMAQIVNILYIAFGIPVPAKKEKGKKGAKEELPKSILKKPVVERAMDISDSEEGEPPIGDDERQLLGELEDGAMELDEKDEAISEPAWDGFDSRSVSGSDGEEEEEEEEDDFEFDDDALAKFDARIAASSDEESDEEDLSKYSSRLAASFDSESESDDDSDNAIDRPSTRQRSSISPSPSPQPKTKKAKPAAPPTKAGTSTFLPTLMGGYWSGSEEEATDDEDVAPGPVVRKNRPGQQARRAIWEKKYGTKANHVKNAPKDDGWDPKRGARGADDRGRGRGRGGFGKGAAPANRAERRAAGATGENATALGKPRGPPKRDDTGPLHASWEAAKKAKEAQKTATFAGKKVTFD